MRSGLVGGAPPSTEASGGGPPCPGLEGGPSLAMQERLHWRAPASRFCAARIRVCSHADSQALKCHSSSVRTHRGACTLAPIRQARDELEALGYEQPVFLVLRFGAILNLTLNLQHSLLANLVALNHRSILVGKTMGIRPRGTRNLPVNWPRDVAIPF